jgi:hypothetical protein
MRRHRSAKLLQTYKIYDSQQSQSGLTLMVTLDLHSTQIAAGFLFFLTFFVEIFVSLSRQWLE